MEGIFVIKTCLWNYSPTAMEDVLVIKNVSVKLFSFFNGWSIGDQERGRQAGQLLQWREYWWSRTCLSNAAASSMEVVLVIKNVSVKLFSFFNGVYIRDEERVSQTLQLLQWGEYWWSRRCLSTSSAPSMEGGLVIRSCLSNWSVASMEGVLVIQNVSVQLISFFNGGCIGDQERSCQTVKLFSFFNGGYIRDEERFSQTLQLIQWKEDWWSRTCLSKLFTLFNGECIGDLERATQTRQLLQWRMCWWSRTCHPNTSASSMEGVLEIKNVSVKLFRFFNGGCIGDQERVCQTLQVL